MANTYSKVYLHIIFAVKNHESLLPAIYLPRIHAYMGGIISKFGHYPCAIGGIDNHVHLMIGYNINQAVPDLVRNLKSSTSRFINDNHFTPFRFEWQTGYGCFSYSHTHVEAVCKYIRNQNEHHKSISLEEEIKNILNRLDVEYDDRYIIR